ncbi:MAG: alpha/beta hydrolase [Planctomycetota bacterium]
MELYRSAVGRFVESAQRLDSFDVSKGVQLESTPVSIRFVGVPWHANEIERLVSIGEYEVQDITPNKQNGLGVPLVALRHSERPFIRADGAFAATALLKPTEDGSMVLDVLDSRLNRVVTELGRQVPIAFDLTAPLTYYEKQFENTWLKGFLRPEQPVASNGLMMVDPYQPGRIPLLMVHGLASDPMTWATMANELTMHPDLMQHYQLWLFQYPTGTPFPMEAAKLREQLVNLRDQIDPNHQDVALDNIVVIGHSMGGLMAKLQITDSGDRLAHAVFAKPITELSLSREQEQQIQATFHFQPSSQIRRVIFLGTPHRGSKIASNAVGRLASKLVREPKEIVSSFSQFARENADALLDGKSSIPTSVDLLRPGNPVLETIFELPVAPHVKLHNVIGCSHGGRFGIEKSDGVVPVSSARHPGTTSELLVDSGHYLHQHDESIREVIRILKQHLTTPNSFAQAHSGRVIVQTK